MEIIKILFLILAYSLGIAALIVQIISYLKDLEYKETIFFTIVFLLLIIASTFQSIVNTDNTILNFQELATNLLSVVFAISIPVNIHKERVDNYRKTRNGIVLVVGTIIAVLVILIYYSDQHKLAILLVSIHLFVSVVYSMFFLLFTKPGLLVKGREKSERLIAVIVLAMMMFSFVLLMANAEKGTLMLMRQNGGIILALICIILSVSKIPGDIKKLIQPEKTVTIEENQLVKLGITNKEQEVLRLLLTGRTYNEIAAELFISLPTVKTHVSNIYSKAKVRNKLELSNLVNQNPRSS